MIRILHVNSTIYINSGVMSVLMNYYKNIDKQVIQFDFLYFMEIKPGYESYQKSIENMGGVVYFIPNFKKIWSFNKKLDKLLKMNNYDAVHIHDPFIVKFIYNTIRKNGINNIIVHSHATQWSDKKVSSIRNKMLCKNILNYADYPVACSYAAGEFLYGCRTKFNVIRNAIDTSRFKFSNKYRKIIRNKINIANKIIFGHVGNFNNQKNHTFLIDIFEQIVSMNDNAFLLLIGDGQLRHEIENKVNDKNLGNYVKFLGKVNDVEKYYSAMDCMILPSLYEGLPMVGVEAQCSGLPILFSDTITKEVGLSNYRFISLNSLSDEWAKHALEMSMRECKSRSNATDIIKAKGFDIVSESKKLQQFYISISGD